MVNRSDAISGLIRAAGVPSRHLANIDLGHTDPGQEAALASERRVRGTGYTMILCGGPGRGKTHLACRIVCERAGVKGADGKWARCLFGSLATHLESIKATYDDGAKTTERDAMASLVFPALLVVDEVHDSLSTEYAGRMLREIVNRRYESLRDTILITNWTPEDVGNRIPPQILSRASESGGVIDCSTWKDWRARGVASPRSGVTA